MSRPTSKTLIDYNLVGWALGITYPGRIVPSSVLTKVAWLCRKGHTFFKRYNDIDYYGQGCPYCSGYNRKTVIDYKKLAEKHHLVWLDSKKPRTTHLKTKWSCIQCGYIRRVSYHHIRNHPACGRCWNQKFKKTIGDYKNMAQRKGITWIGQILPQNTEYKTTWRCQLGHVWNISYKHLRRSRTQSGCQKCYSKEKIKNHRDLMNKIFVHV